MIKKLCFISILLLLTEKLIAQNEFPRIENSISVEVFGSGIFIPTLNYNRLLFKSGSFYIDGRAGTNPVKKVTTWIGGSSINFGKKQFYITTGVNLTYSDIDAYTNHALFVIPEAGVKLIGGGVYFKASVMLVHYISSDDKELYRNNIFEKDNLPWFGISLGISFH
jgi:hypothetical protein